MEEGLMSKKKSKESKPSMNIKLSQDDLAALVIACEIAGADLEKKATRFAIQQKAEKYLGLAKRLDGAYRNAHGGPFAFQLEWKAPRWMLKMQKEAQPEVPSLAK